MNVWNKVLYCLIAVLCVAFSVLAANKYSYTKTKEEEMAKLQKDLADVQDAVRQLKAEIYGAPVAYDGDWRTLSLNAQLDCVRALKRGETFSNCRPVDAATNGSKTTISFTVPTLYSPSAFQVGAIAYVFDSGRTLVPETDPNAAAPVDPDADPNAAASSALPAKFLGAFQIEGVSGAQASLVSSEYFSPEETSATSESAQSGRSWIVCLDRTPVDSPDDLAAISKANSDAFAAYGDELKAFFAKKSVDAPQPAADATTPSAAPEETADARYAVDFQGILDRQWTRRDAELTLKTRREIILARFTDVFFDQLVAIDKIDDAAVAQADAKVQALYKQADYQTRYDAALQRKTSPSFAEKQTLLTAAVEKMTAQRDLVKSKLDEATAAVDRCKASIEATIAENSELASKLARAQIVVAEKLERESASRTASSDANFSFNGI